MSTTEAGPGLAAPLITEWNGNLPAGPWDFVESIGGAVFDPGADTAVQGDPLAVARGRTRRTGRIPFVVQALACRLVLMRATCLLLGKYDRTAGLAGMGVAGASCSGWLFFMQIPELEAPATFGSPAASRPYYERRKDGRRVYVWSADCRLQHTGTATDKVEFLYDGQGRRLAKRVTRRDAPGSPVATFYVWDGWTVVEEMDGEGKVQKMKYEV
jgi:YD repeat-containing protein